MATFGTPKPYAPPVRSRLAASRRVRQREAANDRATGRYKAAKFALTKCPAHWSSKECYQALVHAVATRKAPGARAPESHITLWRWMREVRAAEASAGRPPAGPLAQAARRAPAAAETPAADAPALAEEPAGGAASSGPASGGPPSAIDALADKPGRGRPATELVEPLRAVVRRLAGLAAHSRRHIVRVVRRYARRHGYDVPTEHKVRTALDALGYVFHVAAAQGSRAAQFDAVPHATVPAKHPHDWWSGDTFTCPIPARGYVARGRVDGEDPYVALDCEIVVFGEGHSTAVLSWHLCDPTTRPRKRREGRALRQAGDAGKKRDPAAPRAEPVCTPEEALGAFVSAALPALAPESTRDVAGRLPSGTLRLDQALQDMLRVPLDAIGIEVPELPGLSPPNRGMIERLIRLLKAKLRAYAGARPLYAVATQTEAADAKERNKAASKAMRTRPKIRLAPRDYPDVDALRRIVAEVMWEYNHTLHGYHPDEDDDGAAAEGGADHTGGARLVVSGAIRRGPDAPRLTPFQRLQASLRDAHGRAGHDALRLLPHANVLMQRGSLVHDEVTFGWLPSAAAPTLTDPHTGRPVPHGMPFGVKQAVELRADPLRRGVYAYARRGPAAAAAVGEDRVIFLPRLEDAALAADPALVAKAQREAAAEGTAAARQARYDTLELERGADAQQRAAEMGERATQARRDRAHGAKQKPRGPRATAARAAGPHAPAASGGAGNGSARKVAGNGAEKSAGKRAAAGTGRIRAAADGEGQMALDLPATPSAFPTGVSPTGDGARAPVDTSADTPAHAPHHPPAAVPLALAADAASGARPVPAPDRDPATPAAVPFSQAADATFGTGSTNRWRGAGDPRARVRRLAVTP